MSLAAAILCVAAVAPGVPGATRARDEAHDRIRELLAERRLAEAHGLLPEVEDPLLAARARAEIWYLGRDFAACLDASERGLAHAPGDLLLLHRALGAALWLRDGDRAAALAERLDRAVGAAELDAGERAWWEAEVPRLAADAAALVAAARARDRRVRRAQMVSLTLVGGVLGGVVLLSRGPGRAVIRQG